MKRWIRRLLEPSCQGCRELNYRGEKIEKLEKYIREKLEELREERVKNFGFYSREYELKREIARLRAEIERLNRALDLR